MKILSKFLLAIYGVFLLNSSLLAQELEDYSKYYRIKSYTEQIDCLKPYMIKDLDKIYIKNSENEIIYIVEIISSEGICNYQSERLEFKKGTPPNITYKITNSFNYEIDFSSDFYVSFLVKKISNKKIDISSITVPYFIALIDAESDDIIQQKHFNITLPLKQNKESIYKSKNIKIKQKIPNQKFGNMSLVLGIQLKGNKDYGK